MYKTELKSAKSKGLFLFKKTTKFLNLAVKNRKDKTKYKSLCLVKKKEKFLLSRNVALLRGTL